ncbi:MAG: carboxypeptidase-like regulatory domain-containing protein, partial [Bacteroidales bacterium]|nr:carboxypeptidase-like regulatory domain-containing protein [Bacteroidales bacterium]
MNRKIYKFLTAVSFLLVSIGANAQTSTINGVVKDGITGEPIPGATVMVKGTTNGVATDLDGKYVLNVQSTNGILHISFVGYEPMEIGINGRTVIDVSLNVTLTELDEVVVIGYGTQKKKVVTGAIASISSEEITSAPILRVEQALQ